MRNPRNRANPGRKICGRERKGLNKARAAARNQKYARC
jgi:hypothetical protein